MGLLTPKGKKDDKKKSATKNNGNSSKFMPSKPAKGASRKPMTGGTQRGS